MNYVAVIEIPKDCDRRIHLGNQPHNMGIFEDFGSLKEVIPLNDGKMPMAYGFIKGTVGTDDEGDEVDVLVFSNKEYKTGDETTPITILGIIKREDGDQKVLARDESMTIESFEELPAELQKLTLDFHGFKHKIVSVEGKEAALGYLKQTAV